MVRGAGIVALSGIAYAAKKRSDTAKRETITTFVSWVRTSELSARARARALPASSGKMRRVSKMFHADPK